MTDLTNGNQVLSSDFVVKWIPLLSIIGVVWASLYELGFAWQANNSLQNLLDVSDLVRTSALTIPYIAFFFFAGVIDRVLEKTKDGVFDENAGDEQPLPKLIIPSIYIVAGIDFAAVLLFGNDGDPRLWQYLIGFMIIVHVTVYASTRLQLDYFKRTAVFGFLFVCLFAFQTGRSHVDWGVNSENNSMRTLESTGKELRVVRKLSARIIAIDDDGFFYLLTESGDTSFKWKNQTKHRRGMLCFNLPERLQGTFVQKLCEFDGTIKVKVS